MAKLSFKLPEDTILRLESLGIRYDEVVQAMLTEGVKPLEEQVKSRLSAVIGRDTKYPSRSTGSLVKAVKVTRTFQTSDSSWNIKVGVYGYDKSGTSNALKAHVLEKGKSGQPAKPFLKPAVNASKKECVRLMEKTFDEEVRKL